MQCNVLFPFLVHILPYQAWRNWREGTPSNMIDPSLSSSSMSEIVRCIHIGLLCVEQNIANRPTMSSVVLMLNSYSLTLQIPSQPAFVFSDISSSSQVQSSTYDQKVGIGIGIHPHNQQLNDDASDSELLPR